MNDFAFFSFLWVRRHRVYDNVNAVAVPVILTSEGGTVLLSEGGVILIAAQGQNQGDLYRYD